MKIKLLKGAYKPTRAHDTDAGLDLYALHGGVVKPWRAATFRTGVCVELPEGTAGILMPRSGLMVNNDILSFGVIDQSYRGEIMVHLFNLSHQHLQVVRSGDKISQMLVVPVRYEPVEIVEELSETERGERGFGSTGV